MNSVFSIANSLSIARLFISPINVWCILEQRFVLAGVFFIFAVITDVCDGIFARRLAQPSRVGGILDHCADYLFVSSAMFALAVHGSIPIFLPVLVAFAFIQYVLDSGVFRRRALIPSKLGRWNGISYFVLVGVVIGEQALSFHWISEWFIRQTFAWLLTVTTVLSMGERLLLLWKGKLSVRDSDS